MGVLFNQVNRSDLRFGDHVYSWRTCYIYAHHGIYVGNNDVVHFTNGSNEELAAKANSFISSSIPKQHLSCPRYPDSCVLKNENGGVICSCLDCFLEGGSVYLFEYGVSKAVFFAQVRGNCTLAQSDPPYAVIYRALYLHQNGFGNYDLFSNNCEDFAIYCKTGFIVDRNAPVISGQAAAVNGVVSASRLAYNYRNMLNNALGLVLIAAGTYLYERYRTDIGVRVDKTKVPVEDVSVFLDSSTGIHIYETEVAEEDSAVDLDSSTGIHINETELAEEDSAVDLDSSTGIHIGETEVAEEVSAVDLDSSTSIHDDKTKVPVENVSVFLDSSTGKQPPMEDLAVYHQSPSGIRAGKTKVPVEDVAAFLDSSTRKKSPVEDLAVYLDSSTGIRADRTMAPAAVFLDSPTVKKPPVAESSTSQAISRNRSSKNQKKKFRQQRQRRNCQIVQVVEDVAVFLDSSKSPVAESSTSEAKSRNRNSKKKKKKLLEQHRRNCELVQGPIPREPVLQGN